MTALASVRRRNTVVALVFGVLALALVPVAGLVAGSAISGSTAAVNVGVEPVLEIPPTPVGVLATVGSDGQLTSITAFALAPAGRGGTAVSVPVGGRVRATGVANADMAAVGGSRLADVYDSEGFEPFSRELANLLNTSLEVVEVLAVDEAATMLVEAGLADDAVNRVTSLVTERGTDAELQRWPELGEAWAAAVLAAAPPAGESSAGASSPVAPPTDLESLMAAVFDGAVAYHQLAVEPVLSTEANPDQLDLYDLDRSEVVLVMASVAPSAVVAANPSVAVQIDSSFDFDTTRRAVASLLFVGANVLLVRQVDEVPPTVTEVRTSVRLSPKEIRAFQTLFGEVSVTEADERVEGIDVQIRLGTAFAEAEDEAVSDR